MAKGFSQIEGKDYTETFSPTMRHTTLRVFLTYAASRNYELVHFDIGSAFLNGSLDETIHMRIPEGLQTLLNHLGEYSSSLEGKCLKLKKALYGLKQAPRQ